MIGTLCPPMCEPSRDPADLAGRLPLDVGYYPAPYRDGMDAATYEPVANLDQISRRRLQCRSRRRLTVNRGRAVRAPRRSFARRGIPGHANAE